MLTANDAHMLTPTGGQHQVGTTRVGGVDLNKPRIRAALAAVLALAPSPGGFTVAQFTPKVQAMTGQTYRDYTTRQAAYDLKKLRGKDLVTKLGTARRYQAAPRSLRTIAALLVLCDQVIKPILAGIRTQTRAEAEELEFPGCALRDASPRHAGPLPGLRHRRIARPHNDNILSSS